MTVFPDRHCVAATLCLAALTLPALTLPANAQFLGLTGTQTYTANDGTYAFGTIDMQDTATLNVVNGGSVSIASGFDSSTTNISGGNVDDAVGFNFSTMNISGGNVGRADIFGSSTKNISGGSIVRADSSGVSTANISDGNIGDVNGFGSSTTNISGGSVVEAYCYSTSTTNISGGRVDFAYGRNTSTANISGGTLTNGFLLNDAGATVNFVGTGLSFAWRSFGSNNPYNRNADFFQISGTIGGVASTYNLYIQNPAVVGGSANPAQRQFNLVAPAVVPEAGTGALVLGVGCSVLSFVIRRRVTGK